MFLRKLSRVRPISTNFPRNKVGIDLHKNDMQGNKPGIDLHKTNLQEMKVGIGLF